LNNDLLLDKFEKKKWSVYKDRRRSSKSVQNAEKNENIMIFGGNLRNISLQDSSDNDSTTSDDGKDS